MGTNHSRPNGAVMLSIPLRAQALPSGQVRMALISRWVLTEIASENESIHVDMNLEVEMSGKAIWIV